MSSDENHGEWLVKLVLLSRLRLHSLIITIRRALTL